MITKFNQRTNRKRKTRRRKNRRITRRRRNTRMRINRRGTNRKRTIRRSILLKGGSEERKKGDKRRSEKKDKEEIDKLQIISKGNDGVVVRLQKSPIEKDDFLVAKFYYKSRPFNTSLHKKLHEIDPHGEYFAEYYPVNVETLGLNITDLESYASKPLDDKASVSPLYYDLKPKSVTRKQYRHLRKAVDLLTKNNIIHGDLPENAMLKKDGTPVLIDFAQSKITSDKKLLQFQNASFLQNFKVAPKK